MEVSFGRWYGDGSPSSRHRYTEIAREVLGGALERLGVEGLVLTDSRLPEEAERSLLFHVVLNGSSNGLNVGRTLPGKVYGVKLKCETSRQGREPSGQGVVITDPDGEPLAELVGDSLYILFRLNHEHTGGRFELFRLILQEAAVLLMATVPSLAQLSAGPVPVPDPLVVARGGDPKSLVRDLDRLVVRHREILKLSVESEAVPTGAEDLLERLAGIPEIRSIRQGHSVNELECITHTMHLYDPWAGRLRELGQFSIRITPGSRMQPVCRNITRRPNFWGHPHVDRDNGGWCKGEAAPIERLVESGDLEAALLMTIAAIETVNDKDSVSYERMLADFPAVPGKPAYPAGPATVDEGALEVLELAVVCGGDFKRLRNAQQLESCEVRGARLQRHLAVATLARLLEKPAPVVVPKARLHGRLRALVRFVLPRPPIPPPRMKTDVTAKVADEMRKVALLPAVTACEVSGDALVVRTGVLTVRDTDSGTERPMGPFTVTLNLLRGTASYANENPLKTRSGQRHAPHVAKADGTAPVSPMSAALPVLLGSLQLEAAVRMALAFLTEFDGSLVPAAWRTVFRRSPKK